MSQPEPQLNFTPVTHLHGPQFECYRFMGESLYLWNPGSNVEQVDLTDPNFPTKTIHTTLSSCSHIPFATDGSNLYLGNTGLTQDAISIISDETYPVTVDFYRGLENIRSLATANGLIYTLSGPSFIVYDNDWGDKAVRPGLQILQSNLVGTPTQIKLDTASSGTNMVWPITMAFLASLVTISYIGVKRR